MDYENFMNAPPPHQNTNDVEVKGCAYALAGRPESNASNQPYCDDDFLESQYGDEAPLTPPRQNADHVEAKVKGCVYALAAHPESGTEASGQPYDDNAPLTPPARQPLDDENVPLSQLVAPQPPQPPDDDDDNAPLVRPAVAVAAISPP